MLLNLDVLISPKLGITFVNIVWFFASRKFFVKKMCFFSHFFSSV